MKNSISLFLMWTIVLGVQTTSAAQNIGIGHNVAEGLLDLNGDLILRSADITLTNGTNLSVDVEGNPYSTFRISGPTSTFNVAGVSYAPDGKLVTFFNRSGQVMTILNENTGAAASERIITGTGDHIVLPHNASVLMQYDGAVQKWVVKSHSAPVTASGQGPWLTGNSHIYNSNSGNVGIGTQFPLYKLTVAGSGSFLGSNPNFAFSAASQGGSYLNTAAIQIVSPNTDNYPAGIQNNVLAINGNQIQSFVRDIDDPSKSDITRSLAINPLGGSVGIGTNYIPGYAKLEIAVSPESRAISTGDGIVGIVHFLGGANRSINSLGGYFGTSTNHPLHFYTNSQWAQASLLPNGNFGISTTEPASKLDVQGSLSLPIRTEKPNIPANTSQQILLGPNDYTLYIDAAQLDGTLNILIPDPATCKGRIYIIKVENQGSILPISIYNAATLESTGHRLKYSVSSSLSAFSEGELNSLTLQSTGEKWLEIDRDYYYYKYLKNY